VSVDIAEKNWEYCVRINKGGKMKTIRHEVKLERSVKIILGVFALGIFLNAFATPIAKELFGTKSANAFGQGPIHRVTLCGSRSGCGFIGVNFFKELQEDTSTNTVSLFK
tara:strand:- start:117 stop:446 length:330 start_codon:yes stop_codon:yes gene_type:complete